MKKINKKYKYTPKFQVGDLVKRNDGMSPIDVQSIGIVIAVRNISIAGYDVIGVQWSHGGSYKIQSKRLNRIAEAKQNDR